MASSFTWLDVVSVAGILLLFGGIAIMSYREKNWFALLLACLLGGFWLAVAGIGFSCR